MNMGTIILILLISISIGAVLCKRLEKRDFNGGICPVCGGKLKLFDKDSQGGRGYHCDNCGYSCWCSYDVDKDK